jgi:hypothetical protein
MDIPGAIEAITRFVATASATELAAVFAFPLAFLVVMVLLFRNATGRLRAAVFLAVFAVAALLLGAVVYFRLAGDDEHERLAREIELGCIPFDIDQYALANIPYSLQERLDAFTHLFLYKAGYGIESEEAITPEQIFVIGAVEGNYSQDYALAYGERRANAAAQWLMDRFHVPAEGITIMSVGRHEDYSDKFARVGRWTCGAYLFTQTEFDEWWSAHRNAS